MATPKKPAARSTKTSAAESEPPQLPLETLTPDEKSGTFDEIAERVKEREADLTPARKAVREKHDQEIMDAASTATVDGVIKGIGALRLGVNTALDALSADLMAQTRKLAQIEEAIALRSRHLSEFYEIEVAADTLASLVSSHEQKKAEFESDSADREVNLEQRLESRRKEAEVQMSEARIAWEAEKRQWHETFEQEKAQAAKDWAREQEEHEYTWKLRRTRDEEEFKARRAAQQSALAEEKARAEAQLLEREERITAQEKEVADLRARAEGFSAELERVVQQARTEATSAAEERTKTRIELLSKDADSNEKLLKLRIQGLEQTAKELAARNESLQQELRESTDKVRDIAMKAIEGASGATALSRVSEIALQQAKGRET